MSRVLQGRMARGALVAEDGDRRQVIKPSVVDALTINMISHTVIVNVGLAMDAEVHVRLDIASRQWLKKVIW